MLDSSLEMWSYLTPRYRAIQIIPILLNQLPEPLLGSSTGSWSTIPLRPTMRGGILAAPPSGSPLAGRMPGRDPITTLAEA